MRLEGGISGRLSSNIPVCLILLLLDFSQRYRCQDFTRNFQFSFYFFKRDFVFIHHLQGLADICSSLESLQKSLHRASPAPPFPNDPTFFFRFNIISKIRKLK
ncbi:hypothetical protein TWF751_003851 [Orbilia oligospora]|nr:hypothetical protein TWF751_003851 [Orbilia oligospora]